MSRSTVVSSKSKKNWANRWVRRLLFGGHLPPRQVLMIMGAQRSGTTLLSRIFDDLYYADVFGEFSKMSSDDRIGLRLNCPQKVNGVLTKSKANLVLMKPLVESQRAQYWLKSIPRSKIVWLYRDFHDVAASSVLKFGEVEGGDSHLRAFVDEEFAKRDYVTWKSENASKDTLDVMMAYQRDGMSPHDSAALFWFARNTLFFEQNLDSMRDVLLVKYEEFVKHPFLVMAYILDQFGICEIRSNTLYDIHRQSVGKGSTYPLHDRVRETCSALLSRLDQQFYRTPLGLMLAGHGKVCGGDSSLQIPN